MRFRLVLGLCAVSLALAGRRAPAVESPPVDYNRDVRPILSKNCFACHGPDEGHRVMNLRLDAREVATGPRAGRPAAIVPGDAVKSLVVRRISAADNAGRMPPPANGRRLTAQEVATLRLWIQQGARYEEHWAWVKPRWPALPKVKDKRWPKNPIDTFILARLEKAGLKPSPEADRFTLLRRVSLDLRGIPPTPEEVAAYVKDTKPGAYERAVDRFLADPAYGERW